MPTRLIKESICTSDTIAALSDFEFRLWVGLITHVDDAGRYDARPAILKGSIFPLRERVTVKDIEAALHGLAAKGCVSLYEIDGKPYLLFPTWAEHQRVRDCKPKYPAPSEECQSTPTCGELPQPAADFGYNPHPNPNPNPNTTTVRTRTGGGRPSVEECRSFCREKKVNTDADAFYRHFNALDWIVGGEPVRNWKALLIKWAEEHPIKGHSTTQDEGDLTATKGSSYNAKSFMETALRRSYG